MNLVITDYNSAVGEQGGMLLINRSNMVGHIMCQSHIQRLIANIPAHSHFRSYMGTEVIEILF